MITEACIVRAVLGKEKFTNGWENYSKITGSFRKQLQVFWKRRALDFGQNRLSFLNLNVGKKSKKSREQSASFSQQKKHLRASKEI